MKKITLTKTEVHKKTGYYYDGTFECAKQIYESIKSINPNTVKSFNLKYNFEDDTFVFDWGGFKAFKGDFIAFYEDENSTNFQYSVEVYTPYELKRWGFELLE